MNFDYCILKVVKEAIMKNYGSFSLDSLLSMNEFCICQ